MNKKIKGLLWNIERKEYLKAITNNFGNIKEEKDKIICYVSPQKIDKYLLENTNIYILNYRNSDLESVKKNLKKYNLNKEVHYIFDGITFPLGLKLLNGSESLIAIFKNCKFMGPINIKSENGNITFENNEYQFNSLSTLEPAITLKELNNISFLNEKLHNHVKIWADRFGINIDAKEIKIKDSIMNSGNDLISFNSEKIKIEGSDIIAKDLYINTQKYESENSTITAERINNKINQDTNVLSLQKKKN